MLLHTGNKALLSFSNKHLAQFGICSLNLKNFSIYSNLASIFGRGTKEKEMDTHYCDSIKSKAHPISFKDSVRDYDPLMRMIGDAKVVLLGEASHGTHEFYYERAKITKRLVEEKGFTIVLAEADWPDSAKVYRYVQGVGEDFSPDDALSEFKRFPQWMWRNKVMVEFLTWMKKHNSNLKTPSVSRRDFSHPENPVGFYGMDLYSLYASMEAVIDYLKKVDPEEAENAKKRYACFDHTNQDPQLYGALISGGFKKSCHSEVVKQLIELRKHAADFILSGGDNQVAVDEQFIAEMNARVVLDAEKYYRTMFSSRDDSWNLRDTHMFTTLIHLLDHVSKRQGSPAKAVVWAHNSHLGDARATESSERGELNIGELVKRKFLKNESFSVGFSTYQGWVTAANDWGDPARRIKVNPGLPHSYEDLFHKTDIPNFLLDLKKCSLKEPRLERAIGVVYRPKTERFSHYFHARLSEQFDAIIHFDKTHALEPLETTVHWEKTHDLPDTYPFAV